MLQISYIRQNAALVKERLAVRNFADLSVVDKILESDEQVRKLKTETESIQSSINAASKEIGMLMGKGEKEAAEARKQEVGANKSALQNLSARLADAEKQLQDLVILLPNLPHVSVPKGKTPEDNEVVKEGGIKPVLPASAVPHWELIKKYSLVDFETGAKLTGSGFPLYKGKGAKLQRSLIQYFLDHNTAAGYTEYLPPLMVNEATA
ncbi:MAG TPA: serine--tRNA ligase, partial [Ferruginibacter sp.]|nr:serine--tRNA ligase [Ferruginibacter sp.]